MTRIEDARAPVDVCLVVEGCYPFVSGGVSTWLDWLMRTQPDLTFGIVAITADSRPRDIKYDLPPNVRFLKVVPLAPVTRRPPAAQLDFDRAGLIDTMCKVLQNGDPAAFATLVALAETPLRRKPFPWVRTPAVPSYDELAGSYLCWEVMIGVYQRIAPHAAFADFFWAWRNLVGSLFSVLTAPVPPARCYHSISTGYAGLYAARAAISTGQPAAITEHGIYTNERRIDLVMADWLNDTIHGGLASRDTRTDVRDFWINSFESYATITYKVASKITTLYGANQSMQRALGATEDKLRVIPNGIMLEKFAGIIPEPRPRPTAALIGRVVPIKDIEAFIAAAAVIRKSIPDVEVLIMGPTDEDPEYYEMCKRRVTELGLEDTVVFTGRVNIMEYLPRMDVMVLTSISEAQPLVILEAGAASIPCVSTDVGSCREIIEGAADEIPNLGMAGRVVPPMDANAIGRAVIELLGDEALRNACGKTLRQRVETSFTSTVSANKYRDLYRELDVT
ncbi:GT4 family glycosyltransferase PelF [Pseudogemmobacter sp. W21_MBD1_M6]|uniref:GT4 family glycosyltransferase PelF n=1 Tax=Pseudogemmobacter sp. W21_MBD1_M6 TaxID=3240271 RepID=UPI003F9D4ED0